MNNFFDNQRILTLIWKRKIHFVIVGIIAFALSAVFSGPTFIKPKFKSTARIYPTNLGEMSEESKSEQMLEIVNSDVVKFKMFDAFEGKDIFKISKDDPHYLTYMFDIYNENINTTKTQNETVEIKVMAYDPQVASDMCDSIIHFYNQTVGNMYKAKNLEMIEITKKQLDKKYAEIDSLTQRLTKLRTETGIVYVVDQAPEIIRGYVKALVDGGGNTKDVERVKDIFNNLLEKGAEARELEESFENVLKNIATIKEEYELNLSEYEKNITYSHIVNYPFPADDKSYPVRWLIVLFTTFSAVFVALLVFLVIDFKKEE